MFQKELHEANQPNVNVIAGEEESRDNLVAFLDLLLKIDMRLRPDLYKQNPDRL